MKENSSSFFFINSIGERVECVLAPILLRVIAQIIDTFFIFLIQLFLFFASISLFFSSSQSIWSLLFDTSLQKSISFFLLMNFTVYFLYFFLQESFNQGQTLGKKWMNVRVVSVMGGNISMNESMARNIIKYIEVGYFSLIAVIVVMFHSKNKRIGDILADTYVIFEEPHKLR